MRIRLGLLAIAIALASYSLPASASMPSPQIQSGAAHKVYKQDIGKSGPVGKQETIELDTGADA
jgi:hypothetical protein